MSRGPAPVGPCPAPSMTALLTSFHLSAFRNYAEASLVLESPVTLISGPNGAGKTSLLEAIHVLATGRSFRTGRHDKLVQYEQPHALLRAEIQAGARSHRIGMQRDRQGLAQLKLDGERVRSQSPVAQLFPVVAVHPDTVDLVEGGSEGRRRLLDWLMFHVEHDFLDHWRALRHAVRQRNQLLKKRALSEAELRVWDRQVVETSDRIDQLRRARFQAFEAAFHGALGDLGDDLETVSLNLFSGWPKGETLSAVLAGRQEQDRARGFTSAGAHRMDIRLQAPGGAVKEVFSRGQKKLVAYALVLAALAVMADTDGGKQCLVLVDDLSSELDTAHGARVLAKLATLPHQVIITSLDPILPVGLASDRKIAMFHVEHGELRPVDSTGN